MKKKICTGVVLRTDLTGHSQLANFCKKRVGWPCPVRSALKRTPIQDFNSFSMIFYHTFSSTYQRIGDLFCPVIFLDFRSVTRQVANNSKCPLTLAFEQ